MYRKIKKIVSILRYVICLLISMATIHFAFSQITAPTEISGISAWWCADSVQQESGTPVAFWNNLANTSESVSQPVADNSPTLIKDVSEVNNHAVLRFDGTDYLDGGNILNVGSVGQTVFCIGLTTKKTGSFYAKSLLGKAKNRHFLIIENVPEYFVQLGTSNYMPTGLLMLNEYVLYSGTINMGKQISLFQDGYVKSLDLPSSTSIISSYNFYVGTYNDATGMAPYPGLNLNGDIAEMIFYNRPLSNIERQTVENYLRSKYFPGTEREQFSLGGTIKQSYSLKPVVLSVPEREYFKTYTWNTGETTKSISVDKSGLYSVHVTDDWGYDYIDTVHIVLPTISYIPSQTICDGQSVVWNCGLSGDYTYEWSSGENTQEISISKAGKYAVKITDNQGYSIVSDTVIITEDDFSTMAKLGADTTLCAGNSIGLVSHAAEAVSYEWNTGETTETIQIQSQGTYSVMVTNERGCEAYDEIEITLSGIAPIADFVSQNFCFGDSTEFVSNSYTTDNTQISSCVWYVESDTLEGISSKYHFSSAGRFPVRLDITNETGCVSSVLETVVIHAKPIAQFAPKIACQFTANDIVSTSTANPDAIVSTEWRGLQRTVQQEKFEFFSDSVAYYPLSLKVTTEYGCVDSITDSVKVIESPKIEFIHTRTCIGDSVLIFDETVFPSYNEMVSGYWEYDGVPLSYKQMLLVRLDDTLPHSVGLYVKTFNGCLNISRDTIRAHSLPQPQLPEMLFGCVDKDITLKDFGKTSDSIVSRRWTIGDEVLADKTPILQFSESGTYDYSLALTTEYDCSNETAGKIVVEKTPTADFSFFPEYGAAPLDVEFTNLSENAAEYEWTFEQSVVVTDDNPEYIFTDENNSYANLVARSEHGCADSVLKYIPVQLSNMKLQITDVDALEQNGKVRYLIQVLNSGNDIIPEIEFSLSSPLFPTLTELWKGKLSPNMVLTYEFSTKTALKNNELPAYVCAVASIASSNQNQTFYTGTYCKDFSNDFNVYGVTPNPVQDIAVLAFSTKQSESVVVECVDEFGKIRFTQELVGLQIGFHTYKIDLSQVPAGVYVMRVRQGNKKKTVQVIKK